MTWTVQGNIRGPAGSAGITIRFPFFDADGTADNIPLTADQKLPFFLADGTASNIAMTT